MKRNPNYYEILGISPSATQNEIKKAWRFQISAYHPDKFKGELRKIAEERASLINEAYTVLSNQKKRQSYDQVHSARNLTNDGNKFQYADSFTDEQLKSQDYYLYRMLLNYREARRYRGWAIALVIAGYFIFTISLNFGSILGHFFVLFISLTSLVLAIISWIKSNIGKATTFWSLILLFANIILIISSI